MMADIVPTAAMGPEAGHTGPQGISTLIDYEPGKGQPSGVASLANRPPRPSDILIALITKYNFT